MSRDLNQLAKLNTVDDKRDDGKNEAELQMFSDTHFFDLDIGRSTDIATTVDELLMQQEKRIQYPQKQQPLYEDNAGPSYVPSQQNLFPLSVQLQQQQAQQQQAQQQQQQQQQQLPFDFTPFSLAEELPQTSLSIMDIDPLFHSNSQQHAVPQQHQQQQQPQQHHSAHDTVHEIPQVSQPHDDEDAVLRRPTRNPPMQRHELAELYAPKPEVVAEIEEQKQEESSSSDPHVPDDEKRRRNTAASARFRIKKKLREQEMEKNLKSMQQRLSEQDDRIKRLEMENTWLKNLVVEKNSERKSSSLDKMRAAFLEENSSAQALS